MSALIPSQCSQTTKTEKVVCEENGRKMIFLNRNRAKVVKIRVDGCVLTQTRACDFLVTAGSDEEHFVELKGKNVEHALKQLKATIPLLSKGSGASVFAWVISSESPSIQSRFQIEKVKFAKDFKATLVIRTNQATHCLK